MAPKKKYTTGVAPGTPGASTQTLASSPYDQMDRKTLRAACKGRVALTRKDETWKTMKEFVVELKDADAKKARGLAAPPSRQSLTASASKQVAQPLVNTKIKKQHTTHK